MDLQVIPDSWAATNLGSIVDYGKTQKCELADIDDVTWVVELEDIEKDTSRIISRGYTPARDFKSSKNIFNKGDILYGKLRPYLNKVVMADENGVCSTEIIPINAEPLVINKYIFYWVKSHHFLDYVNDVSYGVNMPRLGTSDGLNAPFILAPFAEQKEIVDRLDILLAQVVATQARLARIPDIIKRFRQSILAAAVSGKLTEDWRGTSSIDISHPSMSIGSESELAPKGWKWEKLTRLAILESGHTPRKSVPEYWENGDVYWLSLQDIREANGTIIKNTKFKPTMKGIENSSARLLPEGTVCFCRDISVGYVTIMGKEMSTTQHFANWICGDELNNKFLMYSFMAAKDHLLNSGQGTTVKTIYMPALKDLRILLPKVEEQTEIVRRVEQLFAYADNLEQQAKAAKARVDNLTQSILAKAFRGELTSDWRAANPDLISGDNSAAALLARIQAERVTASGKKGKRGTSKSRTTA